MSKRPNRLTFRDKVFVGALAFSLLVNVWAIERLRSEVAKLRQAQETLSASNTIVDGGVAGSTSSDSDAPSAGGQAGGGQTSGGGSAVVLSGQDRVGVSKGIIKIGAVITQSGLADQSPVMRGLSAWVQHVNAEGGINGRRIQLIVEDDATDTSRGSAALRKLVENDKVFALVAECAPLTDAQNIEYLKKKGVPVIGSCVLATDQFFKNPFQFPLRVSPETMGRLMGKYAVKDMGAKKPALVQLDNENLTGMGDGTVAQWKEMGVKDYVVETVPVVNPNFTPTIVRLRGQNVDHITLLMDNASTIRFLQAAGQQGWKPKMIGVTGYDEDVIHYGGAQAEDMIFGFFSEPVRSSKPVMIQFREDMKRFYPQEKRLELANNGYHPAWVLTEVMKGLGDDLTRARLMNAFDALKNYDDGVLPPYTLRPGHHETTRAVKWGIVKEGQAVPTTNQWYEL